ncbi:T9SS-dependent choice-of-anchor J family protein [Lacinutrix jangbogonensis]|uniref:T9SS-dependent choice-of-anchor J family protein n=1 Tax=Lacinutrix jangbogonensis TaxID=1469557 RepID=UPI00053F160F|nr:choice-of-anchor J domain-containing protein [Lacinutrix jangbogonensis]
MKKYLLVSLSVFCFTFYCNAQNVTIPDEDFKVALLNHIPIIDSDGDGEIQTAEAIDFSGILDVSQSNISNLTGLEAFVNIKELLCNNNALTSIDITNNTLLINLNCAANVLTELIISQNTALDEVSCNGNNLTTINTSLNTNLKVLNVAANSISSLNLSTNIALKSLKIDFTPITSIDISNNINLEIFKATYCYSLGNVNFTNNTLLEQIWLWYSNQTTIDVSNMSNLRLLYLRNLNLNALNVSNNPNLFNLYVTNNYISELDISNNLLLAYLSVDEFLINTIDVSNNTSLEWLDVSGNQLESINARNGTNTLFTNFQVDNASSLQSICVDDITYATTNFNIPTTSYFSEICSADDCDAFAVNYSEGFETLPQPIINPCWRKVPNTYSSSSYYVQTTNNSHTGNNGVTLRSNNTSDAFLITPELIDFNSSKRISFWVQSGAQTTLSIGTLSDPNDSSTYTLYSEIDSNDSNGYQWREYKIDFSEYSGSDVYVGFKLTTNALINLDDFQYLESPSCVEPANMTSLAYSTEAILNWSDNVDATSWDIEYGEEGFAQGTGTLVNTTTKPYTLTGLTALTDYSFYVRANCGASDQGGWSSASNFITICQALTAEYNYGFDDSYPTEFYECWNQEGSSYIASSGGNTPQSVGYINMYTYAVASLIITPELADLNTTKRIKLWVNNKDGDSGLTIGTIQNPNDLSTFTPYQTFTSSELPLDEWKKLIINFDTYSGTDRFIGIRQDTSVSGADIYVDDFTYQVIPSCLEPTNLEVTALTDTEISIQWLEQATANSWEIEYGISGFVQGNGTVSNASVENNTISGLIPDTQYDIYVRSNCSPSDASEWITIYNINTTCGPTVANYEQHFDASFDMANCWLTIPEVPTGNTNAYEVTISNQYKVGTSGYSARFVDYDLDTNVFLISPEFSDLASGNTRVKFWLHTRYSDAHIIVGTISDPTDKSTFTPIETILNTDMLYREWKQFSINLDGYTGTDMRLAFKMELTGEASNIYDFIYFDAFEYTTIPTCQTPTLLENSDISNGELTLVWQENNGATQWEIEYGEAGFWLGDGAVIQTTSNPYNVQGLALDTTYDFYVRTICDSNNVSDWSEKTTVDFGCGESYNVGYTQDFNSTTLDGCWTAYEFPSNNYYTVIEVSDVAYNGASGHSMYLQDSSNYSSNGVLLVSPVLNNLSIDKKVEFYIHNYNKGLIVGTMSNPNDYSTFEELEVIVGSVNNSTWEKRVVYLTNYNGTDKHIAFRQKKLSSSYGNQVYIDDFTYLQSVICNTPTDFATTNILDNSVDLSWTGSGVEAEWEIEYEEVGSFNSEVLVLVTSETYTIENLIEGTDYTVKLRAKCDNDSLYSEWTDTLTFSTGCEIKTANYFESFEFENELSPCWSKIVSGQTPVIYPVENYTVGGSYNYQVLPVSGNQFLNFRNTQDITERYLISRALAGIDNTKRIRFSLISRAYSSSSSYNSTTIEIGTMSDPADASTFTLVDIIQPEEMSEFKTNGLETAPWKEHTIYFDNYTGTDSYIVIKAGNEDLRSEFMLDDFYFEDIPLCTEPLYPEVIDERYDAVDITWDSYQNASPVSWEIEYGPTDFILGTGTTLTASSTNFTIPNLLDDSAYDFYIRANCGSVFSAWSVKQTFKTKCTGFGVGYFENFDAQADGFIGGCWTGLRPAATGNPYWDESTNTNTVPTISDNYSSIAHSAPNVVRLFNEVYHPSPNASDEIILVSPRLIALDNYKVISFWLNPDSSAYATPSEIVIGTLSDPDDYSTFTPYYTITNAYENEDTWTKYEIDLSNYYLTDEYIGIRQAEINERQLVLIDDFEYTQSGCVTPTGLAALQSNNQEVTFSWQDNNTAQTPNAWEIEYGQTGFTQGSGTIVTANTNPFTVQNISAFSTYDYYVRANCNATDGYSNWSVAYTFNVSCTFSAPFYEDFDQYQASNGSNAPIPNFCWTRSSDLFRSGVADISSFYATFGSSPNSGFVGFSSAFSGNPEPLPGYLATPFLADFDNTKLIKFSLRNESQGTQSNYNISGIVVGTMSNPIDRSTFTPFTTIEASEIAIFGREFVVDFSTYTGTDKHIAFMHDTANTTNVYIDNVTYKNIPTCMEPIHVKIDGFSDTTVTLSWENINGSGNYDIEYGATGFTQGTGTVINTSNTIHQISSLVQSASYQFYVRSSCATENSIWIGPINVTTACNTESLPWHENFNTMSNYGPNQLPDCFYGENEWVSSNTNISSYQVGEDDTHYIYFTYDTIGEYPALITPMFNLEAGTTYSFGFKMRKEAGDYSFQSVRVKTGLGNTHESMTNFLNYFSDFDFGFYDFHPIETTFTPVVSGAYSFGLYFTFSSPVHTLTLDSFSLESGYEGLLDPETAPEVFDFETGLPPSFVLEETEETFCSVVTEPGTNKTGNKAISMKLRSTLENWVDTSNNNQKWVSNQNGINKINFEIDATSESSLFMSFDLKQFYANNPNESMFRIIANGNVILDNIYATSNTDYTNYEVDLSSLVGSNIRISLQQLGRHLGVNPNPSDEAYVDNIKFSNGSTLSAEDFNFRGLTYYPNPIDAVFYLQNNTNIDSIEIYNILGQNVYKTAINATSSSINFNDLPSAVYFIKIRIDNTERTLKVIKK